MHTVFISLLTAASLVAPPQAAFGDARAAGTRVRQALTGHGTERGAARVAAGTPAAWNLAVQRPPRRRVEISIRRQRLVLFKGGRRVLVTHVSTGSRRRYCVRGQCATAVTPKGVFHVQRKIRGWRVGRLGAMYKPMYFIGGFAIHGSSNVPARPASHGCVRVPMDVIDRLFQRVRIGDTIKITR